MKLMLHLVKPRYLIPIHGELRHLRQHSLLAQELGMPEENIAVVENGTVIEFKDNKMSIGTRIPGGYVFVDGARVGDVGPAVLREREAISRDGFVMVNLLLDKKTRNILKEPEIITRGFVYKYEADELIQDIRHQVAEVVTSSNNSLQEDLQKSLKSFLHQKTKRRPMVFVVVNEV